MISPKWKDLPRMTAHTLAVVVPPCPAWCTTGPHRPEVMERGTLSVLHGREVGEVEVVQCHEFSADGLISAEEVFLTVAGDVMSPEQAASFARDVLVAARVAAHSDRSTIRT